MAYNCGVSIGVCLARITRVDENGNVIAGENSYVTDSISEATIAVNKETGNTVNVRNGCGCKIASKKFPDTFNWFDISVTFTQMEPVLEGFLLGAATIDDGADTVGIAYPSTIACDEQNPAVALEFWTQNIVGTGLDATYPYFHWVFPSIIFSPGDATLGEENALRVFDGSTQTNGNWGDGPYGDGPPDGQDISEGAWWATADALPTAECAAQSVTAVS